MVLLWLVLCQEVPYSLHFSPSAFAAILTLDSVLGLRKQSDRIFHGELIQRNQLRSFVADFALQFTERLDGVAIFAGGGEASKNPLQ